MKCMCATAVLFPAKVKHGCSLANEILESWATCKVIKSTRCIRYSMTQLVYLVIVT